MPYTVGDIGIRKGILSVPFVGTWHLNCSLDTTTQVPTGPTVLQLGSQKWVGTVYRSDVFAGTVSLRVIGGAGALSTPLTGRCYRAAPVSRVVDDALASVGEARSRVLVDDARMKSILPFWSYLTGTTPAWVMHRLREHLAIQYNHDADYVWRTLRDGTVYLGRQTYTDVAPTSEDVQITQYHVVELAYDVAMLEPKILPGMSWGGRHIDRLELEVLADGMRGTVFFRSNNA